MALSLLLKFHPFPVHILINHMIVLIFPFLMCATHNIHHINMYVKHIYYMCVMCFKMC